MPRRKVNVKKEISNAFLSAEGLTWPELMRKTGISKGSLSKHLNDMIRWGLVEIEVDTSVRPPVTVYMLRTKKIGRAIDYLSVPINENLPQLEKMLSTVKKVDEGKRQEVFNRVFAIIVFNLLVDQLITFETALALQKNAKSVQDAVTGYSFLWHNSRLSATAKAVFELLLSDPEYERLFSKSVTEVIWITEKIRQKTKHVSDLEQALKQLIANLGIRNDNSGSSASAR